MGIYILQDRMVLPEYGSGTKKVQEFFLTEEIWDDMEGTYVEEPFQSFPVINDLAHLRNFITYHQVVVFCPKSDVAFDSADLPKNRSLVNL